MLALARPELPRLSIATFALLISSGMSLAYPQAIRYMVDSVVSGESPLSLDTTALILVGVFGLQSIFATLRGWLFTAAGERIVATLRSRVFDAILGQEIGFFDVRRTGELTNRLSADTAVLQNTVTVNVSMALRQSLGALGGIIMLLVMSPRLTGVAMAFVPLGVLVSAFYGRWLRRISAQVQDALAAASTIAQESIAGVRTVRSFARERYESERYDKAIDHSYELAAKRALYYGGFSGMMGFFGYGAVGLIVWYGGRQVAAGTITVGELTAFLLYTGLVAVSFGSLASLYGDFMRAIGASERVFELLDATESLELQGADESDLPRPDGAIRFDNVGFEYPSRPDVAVLRDFNLSIEPGEVVALVGPSGAGKSTVASLIYRFYDPSSGRITLDGRDLTSMPPRALREHIGAVMQEPVLFAASVEENIRYGKPTASLDEVRAAARTANAAQFIEDMPDGYDTVVGERGVRLSGGQKQRVAIARAVLKNPVVLILDEATSALDAESESLVQEALERLMRDRTTLIIAHRLSTVRTADRVVVLDQGSVSETGSHDELYAARGLYHQLVERQFMGSGLAS